MQGNNRVPVGYSVFARMTPRESRRGRIPNVVNLTALEDTNVMEPQREIRSAFVTLLRMPDDHTGNCTYPFAVSTGIDTPELDESENDYAVGLVVQTIANGPYKNATLIFVIEDDAQDGGDHVDTHRSVAFIAGPYVKQGAVVSTSYNAACLRRVSCQYIATSANPRRGFTRTDATHPEGKWSQFSRRVPGYSITPTRGRSGRNHDEK